MRYERAEMDEEDWAPDPDGGRALADWQVIGALSGAALFGLLCLVALPEKQSVMTVAARALAYTAAAGGVGATVLALLWAICLRSGFQSRRVAVSSGFVQAAAEGCVFLPCIVLLQLKQSVWMLAFAALATAVVWRGVGPLVAFEVKTFDGAEGVPRDGLAALYGLPAERLPLGRMVFLAVCVQAAAVAAVAGLLVWASSLLAVWLLAMLWRWEAGRPTRRVAVLGGWKEFWGMTGLAVLLTIVFLLPSRFGGPGGAEAKDRAMSKGASGEARGRDSGDGYAGIILLAPAVKKAKLVAPKPRTATFAAGRSEPLVIPFDGAYWYFKAPAKRPSARAHVAQGKATEVTVRSSDRYPLLMEAHQSLGAPIELECCREIEVALTNADTRLGTIAVGVMLTDTSSAARPRQLLGMKTLASSDLTEIPAGRTPVEETVRFAIPRGLKQCDEITVVFVPGRERERTGAKVSVRSFVLLPR